MGCAKCGKMMKKGGVKKMAAGGSTTNKLNNARGFAPAQKGGDNAKKMIYGVPNAGMTGPNRNSQTETMKKGGAKKSKMVKAQKGMQTPFQNYMKTTPGATASDTSTVFTGSSNTGNPKLDKAYYDTYYAGQEGKRRKGADAVKYDSKGNRIKMAKGGSTFGMLSVKAGVDKNPNPTAADRIAGAKMKKAKFGASVNVQRSPKAGKVRAAGDQGYAPVGKREPGRIIKKIIGKKK